MRIILTLLFALLLILNVSAQSNARKIYDTEKEFEKAVAEKGVNAAFIEFSAPDGVCFFTGEPANCREFWRNAPKSPAFITWNPTFIDVSSNGTLAYSIGNSVYRPNGKADKAAIYGEYATVWARQPNGQYRVVLDIGISHEQPNNETKWSFPSDSGNEMNAKKISAADASAGFFETAVNQGINKAYKLFLAEDAKMLREGKLPIYGKHNALNELKNIKSKINFSKITFFVEASDMAYISNSYNFSDKHGKIIEKGNFLQVWKLRNGKWQIVLDVFLAN